MLVGLISFCHLTVEKTPGHGARLPLHVRDHHLLQVYQTEQGTLRKVLAAVRRGRQMHCSHCGRRGATLGCLLERCPCSFHLPCAGKAGCAFHCSSYTLACKEHARLFRQKPEDVGWVRLAGG